MMMNPFPAAAVMPDGVDTVDLVFNTTTEYSTAEVDFATGYQWEIVPAEAGTIAAEATVATVDWSDQFTGEAEIIVHRPKCMWSRSGF
ncbi:MAG: hypothetical protein U5L09_16445 [Bacteroidales bacterium]|nr:hypothetical protein [Bacteroidales bacterium]